MQIFLFVFLLIISFALLVCTILGGGYILNLWFGIPIGIASFIWFILFVTFVIGFLNVIDTFKVEEDEE